MLRSPLVDLTTVNGVESLFHKGPRDPYGKQLAARLADLIIYSDTVRYALPIRDVRVSSEPIVPDLLANLASRDRSLFCPERYSTAQPLQLKMEYLSTSLKQFDAWARANPVTLRRLLALHCQPWIRSGHWGRAYYGLVFDVERLRETSLIGEIAKRCHSSNEMVCYAIDVVLRYPVYGDLAGEHQPYLNHPIRDSVRLPTEERKDAELWGPSISFAPDIQALVSHMSLDEYTALIHELRGWVHHFGLHRVGPGAVDREVVREIAQKVGLPPHLKAIGKGLAVAGGVLTGVGAVAAAAPAVALVGSLVAVSSAIWDGRLPRSAGRAKWLQWAFRWEAESRVEGRDKEH